jgi:hypothetical protein
MVRPIIPARRKLKKNTGKRRQDAIKRQKPIESGQRQLEAEEK